MPDRRVESRGGRAGHLGGDERDHRQRRNQRHGRARRHYSRQGGVERGASGATFRQAGERVTAKRGDADHRHRRGEVDEADDIERFRHAQGWTSKVKLPSVRWVSTETTCQLTL